MAPTVLRTLLAALAAVALLAWICLPPRLDIVGPRLGIPAIVEPGASFTARVRGSWPMWGSDWSAVLENGKNRIPLTVAGSDGWTPRRQLTLQTPSDLAPGSYRLRIGMGNASHAVPMAVHVLDEIPENFSIVHIADLPEFGEPDGKGEVEMAKIVSEIQLINPDLVIAGGDIAYGASWANFETLYDFFLRLDMPIIVAPGNHEYEAWNGYLAFFRQRYHSVDFGRWRIITLDSGHRRDQPTYSQVRWLGEQLAEQGDDPVLINLHHPVFGDRGLMVNVEPLMRLFKSHNVPLVLSGHNHGDRLYDRNGQRRLDTRDLPPPLNIVTTSAGDHVYKSQSDSPLHHGYRLIRVENGKVANFTYDYDGDGQRDVMSSIPVGHLSSDYSGPNQAVVRNDLNESFAALRLRIPADRTGLRPSAGKLIEVSGENGLWFYTVDLPMPANSQRSVRLLAGGAG